MALGKKITGENGALIGNYHRIRTTVTDYDKGQQHIFIAHYAGKAYRDEEKAEIEANKVKIARHEELAARETLTEDERLEFENLNIQALMAFRPKCRTCQPDTKMTIEIGADVREEIYNALGGEFENAKNV